MPHSSDRAVSGSVLLEADWVLPVSSPPIPKGAVVVDGGVIRQVGPAADIRARVSGIVDEAAFPGCVLMPGFVNSHSHLEYSAFRGFCPPVSFPRWLLRLLVARSKLSPEDWEASALWGAYECVRSGITSIADTSYEGGTVARAARAAGLRARIYLEVFGLNDAVLPATMAALEARLARLRLAGVEAQGGGPLERSSQDRSSLVEWGISPHAPYTVSARLYRETARFARHSDLPLATHVAESPAEVEMLRLGVGPIARVYKAAGLWKGERWRPPGVSPVQYVATAGALGSHTLVIHSVQVDEADIAVLASSGAAVAHCPRSNRWLQCGAAPVRRMQAAGVVVGLGTDGLCSNEDLDMFAEMRAAAAAGALRPAEVLRLATLDGARALGWEHLVGSLEPGKRADLVVVRCNVAERKCERAGEGARCGDAVVCARAGPGDDPGPDPVEELVCRATASDIVMTMVDGAVVFCGTEPPAEVLVGLARTRRALGLPPL